MTHGENQIQYWVLYEYSCDGKTDIKRPLIIRERRDDLQRILNAIQESNINFEGYQIEGYVK